MGSREVALSQVKVQNRSDSGLWLGRILEVPVKAGIVYLFAGFVVRVSPVILDVSEYHWHHCNCGIDRVEVWIHIQGSAPSTGGNSKVCGSLAGWGNYTLGTQGFQFHWVLEQDLRVLPVILDVSECLGS